MALDAVFGFFSCTAKQEKYENHYVIVSSNCKIV